jgi:hypothetical protein
MEVKEGHLSVASDMLEDVQMTPKLGSIHHSGNPLSCEQRSTPGVQDNQCDSYCFCRL